MVMKKQPARLFLSLLLLLPSSAPADAEDAAAALILGPPPCLRVFRATATYPL